MACHSLKATRCFYASPSAAEHRPLARRWQGEVDCPKGKFRVVYRTTLKWCFFFSFYRDTPVTFSPPMCSYIINVDFRTSYPLQNFTFLSLIHFPSSRSLFTSLELLFCKQPLAKTHPFAFKPLPIIKRLTVILLSFSRQPQTHFPTHRHFLDFFKNPLAIFLFIWYNGEK